MIYKCETLIQFGTTERVVVLRREALRVPTTRCFGASSARCRAPRREAPQAGPRRFRFLQRHCPGHGGQCGALGC